MGLPQAAARLDREAYFDWEATQTGKNETLAGEVLTMVGARQEHNLVSGALYARFREHLRGTRCRAHVADMKQEVREYLLVDVEARRLELYRREPVGWVLHEPVGHEGLQTLQLQSMALALTADDAFGDLDDAPGVPETGMPERLSG